MKKNKNILVTPHNYTEEDIKSIKANLKKAFGTEYIPVELKLGELLKNKNMSSFKYVIGEQYAFFSPMENKELGIQMGWHILEVTYQRGELVFFKVPVSTTPRKEHYAEKNSIFVRGLVPLNFDTNRFGIPEENLVLIEFKKGETNPFYVTITTPAKTYLI